MMMELAGNTFLLLAFATSVIAYLWIYRWRQSGQLGPKEWPLVGCLFEAGANAYRTHDWSYDYMKKSPTGTIVFTVTNERIVFVSRPDNVEHMLKTNFSNYITGPILHEKLTDLLGNGIFLADGDAWRQQRRIASLEFSSRKLRESSTDAYREHALRLMLVLDTAAASLKQVDIQDLFLRMAMDSICKIGFGVDQQNLSPDLPDIEFARAFDTLALWALQRSFDFIWKLKKKLNLGRERKFRALLPVVDSFIYDVIRERRREIAKLQSTGHELGRHDLLSRFLSAKDQNGEGLSDSVLRDSVLNFLLAGRDTSACTLAWFVYMLCLNPEVAEKCYEEMDKVFGEKEEDDLGQGTDRFYKFGSLLTYESLGKLDYLHAALGETLRLYTPVSRDDKYALKDDILPDGTVVKSGDQVCYLPYVMGRLELLWGPDALEFRPERWLKDGCYQPESPFKFATFQAGPRVCIGIDSAYLQMRMTAAMFLRWFRFTLVPSQVVAYNVSLVTTIKNGLKITVQRM